MHFQYRTHLDFGTGHHLLADQTPVMSNVMGTYLTETCVDCGNVQTFMAESKCRECGGKLK